MFLLVTVLLLLGRSIGFVVHTRLLRISRRGLVTVPQIRNEIQSTITLHLDTNMGSLDDSVSERATDGYNDFSEDTGSNISEREQIDLLYDSDCPICQMEVDFLQKRDIHHRIRFTDLSSPDYDPAQHGNVRFEDGMRKIRAILPSPDGQVVIVTGVEVFRQTYKAIGLGWIFELTNLPVIGTLADLAYDIWAENRLRITGRGDLADVLKERSEKLRDAEPVDCDADGCALFFDDDDVDGEVVEDGEEDKVEDRAIER